MIASCVPSTMIAVPVDILPCPFCVNVFAVLHIEPAVIVAGIIGAMLAGASIVSCQFQTDFLLPAKMLRSRGRGGEAANPANFASGNTQYELTQGINSPWARRFTLDPMGRLPSTRQWALPLDPNRALHPCTQHKGIASLCTPARRSRLPPLGRFLSAPPALNAPFVAFPGRGMQGYPVTNSPQNTGCRPAIFL